jgi:glycosyltransferase involved in cell wall biosynthesis
MAKYLFIAANEGPSWGGSEMLWTYAAEKLARGGNEVRISVPAIHAAAAQLDQVKSAGCLMFYRRMFTPFVYRVGRRVFPLLEYNRRHVRSVAKNVDLIVISQGGNTDGLPWMRDARFAGRPYAVIAQGATPHSWPDDNVSQNLADSYENANGAYFVSQAILDLSRSQFASPLRNAQVVRNPFNVRYEARPAWPGDTSLEVRLACVARLEVAKGHDLILQALALPHWRRRRLRVSFVGTGPNERIFRRLAETLSLPNVDFLGYSEDVEAVWSKHHALVLASRFEGMSLSVVEAMLCGRPCIVTDVGGNREFLRDGINGFIAKAPTVELLDQAMDLAWENRARLRDMGDVAAADVRRLVSADPAEDFVRELESLAFGCARQ